MPPREPAPGLKNTPQSPSQWETAELASLGAVLEMCPQQRRSTALPQSLHLAGKGLSGSPGPNPALGGFAACRFEGPWGDLSRAAASLKWERAGSGHWPAVLPAGSQSLVPRRQGCKR